MYILPKSRCPKMTFSFSLYAKVLFDYNKKKLNQKKLQGKDPLQNANFKSTANTHLLPLLVS